jgi:GNAT superfamily N-acetyltransferase
MSNSRLRIRPAVPSDIPAITKLIHGLARYERLSKHCRPSPTKLRQHAFGKHRYFEALICESANRPIGAAIYYFTYSTFTSSPVLFIEDIFVEPAARKQGAGTALMKCLASVAIKKGCQQMNWHVLGWNKPAIHFYNRLGAHLDRTWLLTRLTDKNLRRLANRSV